MTCREKLKQMYPNMDYEEAFSKNCPSIYGIMDDPIENDCRPFSKLCEICWDREIPGTENTHPIQMEEEIIDKFVASGNVYPIRTEELRKILDSGARTEFESGAVRDIQKGKGRMDLLPWAAIMEVSKHCENGAIKYGEHNVDRGIPTSSLCDSAARHLAKYLDGWTDEPHLLAATWNLLWAVQMTLKNPEIVNTPWKMKEAEEK